MNGLTDEPMHGIGSDGGAGIIGALIGTGASLYDAHQNRKTSVANVNRTIAAQKAEAELAYQRSVEMWNQQNLYNTPEAQMARFKQAGLNPHLIYNQGSSGLASSPPQYQPANLQYQYEAPQYGAAFTGILPTLMAVGTWMQNMRSSEVDIRSKETQMDKARQLMEYLDQANPRILEGLENKLTLFPYQKSMMNYQRMIGATKLADLNAEYRYKFGEDLWRELPFSIDTPDQGEIGGLRKLQFLQEQSKTKLAEARASWSEFDITDPQAIMQLVLSGVMGLAGQTLRLSTRPGLNKGLRSQPRRTGELPVSIRRLHPSRRVQNRE